VNHDLFKTLQNDLINLHAYWKVYRQLFARSEKRIDLLNESGSLVFNIVQHLFLNEITLSICRFTDPAKTKIKKEEKENHTLERLIQITDEYNKKLAVELSSTYEGIKKSVVPFRRCRNKSIAHSDLLTKLKMEENPLPGISREMVEQILEQMREFMNIYDRGFFDNTTYYEEELLPLGSDGDFLTQQLKRAVAFRDLEDQNKIKVDLRRLGRYQDA
jgi:AbiU2